MISFFLSQPGEVKLEVFDLLGRSVRQIYRVNQAAGYHQVEFNGQDTAGRPLPAGIYFYQIVTSDFRETRKLVILL